jgi:hypothetical protein
VCVTALHSSHPASSPPGSPAGCTSVLIEQVSPPLGYAKVPLPLAWTMLQPPNRPPSLHTSLLPTTRHIAASVLL